MEMPHQVPAEGAAGQTDQNGNYEAQFHDND
jgi:hypothetical protein